MRPLLPALTGLTLFGFPRSQLGYLCTECGSRRAREANEVLVAAERGRPAGGTPQPRGPLGDPPLGPAPSPGADLGGHVTGPAAAGAGGRGARARRPGQAGSEPSRPERPARRAWVSPCPPASLPPRPTRGARALLQPPLPPRGDPWRVARGHGQRRCAGRCTCVRKAPWPPVTGEPRPRASGVPRRKGGGASGAPCTPSRGRHRGAPARPTSRQVEVLTVGSGEVPEAPEHHEAPPLPEDSGGRSGGATSGL